MSRNFLERQAMESSSSEDEIIVAAGAAVAVRGALVAEEANNRVSE